MEFQNDGYCPICEEDVTFVCKGPWLRDEYLCSSCNSIPRQRALMHLLNMYCPNWRELTIHESSPTMIGASLRLANQCSGYVPSQFFANGKPGAMVQGVRCENLEALTFADQSVDLHISQDVFEHLFAPTRAFQEIARTLKPGGFHLFTVPLVNKSNPSRRRARLREDGEIEHLQDPQYHSNPIDQSGSLVTVDWGYDICGYIHAACNMFSTIHFIDDLSLGIRAEYIEVILSRKAGNDADCLTAI